MDSTQLEAHSCNAMLEVSVVYHNARPSRAYHVHSNSVCLSVCLSTLSVWSTTAFCQYHKIYHHNSPQN